MRRASTDCPWRPAALATAIAITILVSGCVARIDQRGNLPDADAVLSIQPGVQTKDQVSQLLGTPSSVGTFDDKTWYYISKRTKTTAFFDPDVIDQQVLCIKFDDAGVVKKVDLYGMNEALAIEPVSRTTPTYGQKLTLLQQLFGNIGRFNTGPGAKKPY